MEKLNFPLYDFRIKNSQNKVAIFDVIRKKFVILTPEEWVRQHVIQFLLHEKKYPLSLINVEKTLKINGLTKRYDLVVFNADGTIHILIECKAPLIKISQDTFDQIARYNLLLKARYLMVTNGLKHFYCQIENDNYTFLKSFPDYEILKF